MKGKQTAKDSKQKSNNKNKRDQKGLRKKGAPKWKSVVAEIENINKRIKEEVPPPGVLYYKFKKVDGEEGQKADQN